MEVSSIQIEPTEYIPDIQKIDARLRSLILTREGSIPGNRGFGLSMEFMSMDPGHAVNELAIELADKVSIYIPEIMVIGVEGEPDNKGALRASIMIGRRD